MYQSLQKKSTKYLLSVCIVLGVLFLSDKIEAQVVWSGEPASAWLTGGNWTGGSVPTTTQVAQFNANPTSAATGVGINMNGSTNNGTNNQACAAIYVSSSRSNNIFVGNSSTTANGTLTLNGGTVNGQANSILGCFSGNRSTLTISTTQGSGNKAMGVAIAGSAARNILCGVGTTAAIGNIINITTPLSGTAALTFLGNGTWNGTSGNNGGLLRLGNNLNSFSGGITVGVNDGTSSGILQLDNRAAIANTSGNNITINNNSQLYLNGTTGAWTTGNITLTLNGLGNNVSTTYGSGALRTAAGIAYSWTGPVSLASTADISIINTAGTLTLSGTVSGSGQLVKNGQGTLVLSGSGSWTGGTLIKNGVVTVRSGGSMSTGELSMFQTATNTTALNLNNTAQSISSLSSSFTAVTGSLTQIITLGSGHTLTVNQNTNTSFGVGAVSTLRSTLVGAGALVKSGTGRLTLTGGGNTFSGGLTITGGEIRFSTPAATNATITTTTSATPVTMNGGTLGTSGIGANPSNPIYFNTINLAENSTIDLGTANAHLIRFAASNGVSWTAAKILTITNWTGNLGASGTKGQIFVGTTSAGLTASQLSQIRFDIGGVNYPAALLSTGQLVPMPSVFTVTGGGSYCAGGTGVAVGLSNSQTLVKYQLYNGASTVGTAVTGTGSALSFGLQTAAGTYTVLASPVAGAGASVNMTGSAVITINPSPVVAAISGASALCVGGSTLYTNATPDGVWVSSNTSVATIGTAGSLSAIAAGTTLVSYTVTDGLGCSTTVTTSVTVRSIPTAAPTNNGYICVGGTVTLTANPANGANTYTWSGSSLSATNTANPTATPISTTVYSLTVSDGTLDAGCSPSTVYTTSVTVNATPTAAPTNNGPICNGGSVTLTANGAGGATNYSWSGSSLSSPVVANPTATPTVTAVYSLTVTDGSSQPGCSPATIYTTSVTVRPTPTAAPTNNGYICVGGTVNLTANPANGANTYTWSGSSLSATNTANPTATPISTTVYSLTVSDGTADAGCAPATVYTTSVTVNSIPTAAPTNSGPICNGGTVTLTANGAGGASAYSWSGSSLSSSVVANPTATPTVTTVYSLTVTDGSSQPGCTPATIYTTSVTVNTTPTAAPTNSGPICNGGTVTLTANGAGGASTYSWSGPSLSSSVVANPTATPTVTTVYSLTVTDGSGQPGCSPATIYTTSVTVRPTPTAAPTNNGYICVGGTVTLTANPANGANTYTWSGSSLSATNTANPTATPASTTVYSLTVSDGTADAGCSPATVYTTSVTVNNTTPTAAPTNSGPICNGGTVTLTANGAGGASSYSWSGSSLSSSVVANPTATPTVTTVYSLTVTDGSSQPGCTPATIYTTSVTVRPTPTAAPTNNGYICVGGTVTLTANPANGANTYTWSGSSLSATNTANPTATPISTTVYSLTVSDGTADAGCSPATVYTTSVTVNATPTAAPTNSGPICNGGTVTLTANGAGGASSYSWSGSSLSSSVVANPTATPTVTSVYSLTVTDGSSQPGCAPATIYTTSVTVRPTPTAAPTNNGYICVGGTVTLTANPANGANTYTWSGSSLSATNTENPTATPTSTTVYSLTVSDGTADAGCAPATVYTTSVTVNATPTAAPTNSGAICNGGTVTLTANGAGGATNYSWSGSSLSSSVVANPTATPTVTSVYSLTVTDGSSQPGCTPATIYTTSVTVNPLPNAGTITGTASVCLSGTTSLANAQSGGVWTSSNTAVATVGTGGVVSGITEGNTTISYTLTNIFGCQSSATVVVTVNPFPVVDTITGTLNVCKDATTPLSNSTGGGVWSSSTPSVATIGVTGIVTGVNTGTSTISYTVTSGSDCATRVTKVVTVNPLPVISSVGEIYTTCENADLALFASLPLGTWTSSNISIANIDTFGGLVIPVTVGTAIMSYQVVPTGCFATREITMIEAPTSILGATAMCPGATATLTSTPSGGTWSTYNPSVISINATTGAIAAVRIDYNSISLSEIRYTIPNGCFRVVFPTVNPIPAPIYGGLTSLCVGETTTFLSGSLGNTWSSNNTGIATITSGGVITAQGIGVATISYTSSNGCANTRTLTVNAAVAPSVGSTSICTGTTTLFSNATSGGTWTSSNISKATVNLTSGLVSASNAGTTTLSYRAPSGCYVTNVITVNTTPSLITGTRTVCIDATTTLGSTPSGGTWSSSAVGIASVGSTTGIVSGVASGTAVLTYTYLGCTRTAVVTVNALPAPTTGAGVACAGGGTTALTNASGTWTSSNTGIATVNTSGIVTGVNAGNANITFRASGTGCYVTREVTVNPLPVIVSATVCPTQTATLTATPSGGTWSISNPSVATINATTGELTGVIVFSYGTSAAIVTNSLATGCSKTAVVRVYPVPSAISGGIISICTGSTITLSSSTAGATWSSTTPAVATISPIGLVTGIISGTSTISYTNSSGCAATKVVTVNGTVPANTGTLTVCTGQTTMLANANAGGTWSTSNASRATVNTLTGLVSGISGGTVNITYRIGSTCFSVSQVTVNSNVAVIGGTKTACVGTTTTLTYPVSGGTWSSATPAVATIDINSGAVIGAGIGTSVITYTLAAGCYKTTVVTVTSLPAAITGTALLCQAATTALSSGSGTWSSSNTGIATVNSSGVVTGVSEGNANITFRASGTGCYVTREVTVNTLPVIVSATICPAQTGTLTATPSGGTWSISNPSVATINATTGELTGIIISNSGISSTIVTNTLATGCSKTAVVSVNPVPSGITGGIIPVCTGSTTSLSSSTIGATWSSTNTGVVTISPVGLVTGITSGTSTISYTNALGCATTKVVTVSGIVAANSGTLTVCTGQTTMLANATPGGTWSTSNVSRATVNSLTGLVTGVSGGTVNITYLVGVTCFSVSQVTVNSNVAEIGGTKIACVGTTTTLTYPVSGGTWSSTTPAVATIDVNSGEVTGVIAGTSEITYTVAAGCFKTTVVTVSALSAANTGTLTVCTGQTTMLANATVGGTWSTANASIATVDSLTGLVSGISGGTVNISYQTVGSCYSISQVTVNSNVAVIGGTQTACLGTTTTLTYPVSGGTWSSATPAVATIDVNSGEVTGIMIGTSEITYTISAGCFTTTVVTVSTLAPPITGTAILCQAATTALSNGSGTWSSSNTTIATVDSTGLVTGVSAGNANITFRATATDCYVAREVTVNPLPAAISTPSPLCPTQTATLTSASPDGTWSSNDASVMSVNATTGVITAVINNYSSSSIAFITYTLPTGCATSRLVTVKQLPSPIYGGTTALCLGDTTTLLSGTLGQTWSSSTPGVATVGLSGFTTGVGAGTTTISYTNSVGCAATKVVTVNGTLPANTGTLTVCTGQSTMLANANTGGTWSTSNASIASVNTLTGLVSGISGGTVNITYRIGSTCFSVSQVTVNSNVALIGGTQTACIGTTTTLTYPLSGGTWSSATLAVATIDVNSGVVTGVGIGTSEITYTVAAGCFKTTVVTVTALPAAITGTALLCQVATTTLSSGSGTWSSSNTGIATVNSTGVVTGVSAGNANITFHDSGTGCYVTREVTVNPLPVIVSASVCPTQTATLTATPTGGTWSISNPSVATINTTTGELTGVIVFNSGISSTIVTNTLATGCSKTAIVSVYPVPSVISGGITSICTGSTTTLASSTTGATWTSTNTGVATISPVGLVTGIGAGTSTISYTNSYGCVATTGITVSAIPSVTPITGTLTVCVSATTTLGSTPSGGIWSSSNTTVATVNSSGVVSGINSGTARITYMAGSGCTAYETAIVTVNALPSLITGTRSVCIGATTTLSSTPSGGTWSSSADGIASVGTTTGIVSGVSSGTAVVTYTSSGCTRTAEVTVNALPEAITGAGVTCAGGGTTALTNVSGSWSSSNTSVASVNYLGTVTGINAGNATITFRNAANCYTTRQVTINPLPNTFTTPSNLCAGSTATLVGSPAGGTWLSSNTSVFTINASTGDMNAVIVSYGSISLSVVTYTLPTGCNRTALVTVNPMPATIYGGSTNICTGNTTTFLCGTASATWSSSSPSVATINSSGEITGINGGTATISYTNSYSCSSKRNITVNPTPADITGDTIVATGATITLSNATSGGTWSSNYTSIATINNTTGVVSGISAGTATISYIMSTGCFKTKGISVVASKNEISLPETTTETNNNFSVYPNPTAGYITITTDIAGAFNIYTMDGKMIETREIKEATTSIKLPNTLSAGYYICQFIATDGTQKIVRITYQP